MSHPADPSTAAAPRRREAPRATRAPVSFPVGLYDGKQTLRAELRNFSTGGAFVAIDPPIPIGVGLSFWVPLPGGPPLLLRGHVRWTRSLGGPNGEPVGVGIQFYETDEPTRQRLERATR